MPGDAVDLPGIFLCRMPRGGLGGQGAAVRRLSQGVDHQVG